MEDLFADWNELFEPTEHERNRLRTVQPRVEDSAADTDEDVRAIIEALQKPAKRKRRSRPFRRFLKTLESEDQPVHFTSLEQLVRGS